MVKGGSADVATGKTRMSMRRTSAFYPSYSVMPLDQQAVYNRVLIWGLWAPDVWTPCFMTGTLLKLLYFAYRLS